MTAATALEIALESVRQDEVRALLALSDAYMAERYPPEGNFAFSLDELDVPEIAFAVARLDGRAVGCAGLLFENDGTAEVKRLFVHDAARGLGLGRRLMGFLETLARERGVKVLNLETGPLNVEAVKLYEALGFAECGPFGAYELNPWSLFMTKPISSPS